VRFRRVEDSESKCFEQIMWELEMASNTMSRTIVIRLSILRTSLYKKEVSCIDSERGRRP